MITIGGKDYPFDCLIFLDIDGVLNSNDWAQTRHPSYQQWMAENVGASRPEVMAWRHIDPAAVERLNRILITCNVGIILSSTWRIGEINRKALALVGIDRWDERFLDVTPRSTTGGCRGYEIQSWLTKNQYRGPFCILDDDPDMVHLIGYLIGCNFLHGMMDEEANKAIDFLKKQIMVGP